MRSIEESRMENFSAEMKCPFYFLVLWSISIRIDGLKLEEIFPTLQIQLDAFQLSAQFNAFKRKCNIEKYCFCIHKPTQNIVQSSQITLFC